MVELAEIFRRYGPEYREKYGARMPPSHLDAMTDVERCRTETLGDLRSLMVRALSAVLPRLPG